MAVIGINYNEGNEKDLGYKSVDISYGSLKEVRVFETGNFVKDWFDMRKFMTLNLSESELYFCHLSSIDHFIMDGAPYDSAWLKMEGNKPSLIYEYDIKELIEFFVPEGTEPTWEELKEMCK